MPQKRLTKPDAASSLPFALCLAALMACLLAAVPFVSVATARALFAVTLVPLVLYGAFKNTERGILVYLAWCWMDGVIRGVMGGGAVVIVARDIVLAIVVLGWLGRRLRMRGVDPVRLPPGLLLVVLFVIDCLIQTANPDSLGLIPSLAGLKMHLATLPLLFIGYDVYRRREQLYTVMVFLSIATLIIGALSFVEYTEGRMWTWAHYPGSKDAILQAAHVMVAGNHVAASGLFRPPGATGGGGFTGLFVGCVFPVTFGLALVSRKLTGRVPMKFFAVAVLFAFIVFIFINAVRAALVEAIVGALLCAALIGGRQRVRAFFVLGAALLIGAAAWTYTAAISGGGVADRFATTLSDPIGTLHGDRMTMFEEFGDVVSEAPLGVGLGRVGGAAGHLGTSADDSLGFAVFSESYVDVMIFETGLPGSLLITSLSVTLFVLGYRALKRLRDSDDRCVASALLASYGVMLLCFPVLPVLLGPPGSILYWLFAAGLLGVYGAPRQEPGRKAPAHE